MSDEGGSIVAHSSRSKAWTRWKSFDISETLSESQLGIVGMRELVHFAEGSMTVKSSLGRGATICTSVPLPGTKLVSS